MQKINILLIEDEVAHCAAYRARIAEEGYIHTLHVAHGVREGMSILQKIVPDIILLDLELNQADGNGLDFLHSSAQMWSKKKPYIIVITNNPSGLTHALARSFGADFIFTKIKPDYSPAYVIQFAQQIIRMQNGESIPWKTTGKKNRIEDLLDNIGITYEMDGRSYLLEAIQVVMNTPAHTNIQLKKHIYPILAEKFNKTEGCIDKAINNAIKKAWRETDLAKLARIYTAEVSYARGLPTNKEFIFYIADKIRKT